MNRILITGGTGLVGRRLSELLTDKGVEIHILSRVRREDEGNKRCYKWSVEDGYIEDGALDVDGVIHLAGASVADKCWTASRRREIRQSRVESARLLRRKMAGTGSKARFLVSASAVGFYGDRNDEVLTESAAPGNDFLAEVCREWEEEVLRIGENGIAVSAFRIGIVLSALGGALPKLAAPVRLGVGAYLGNGSQYYPWIHIDDLCRMFIFAAENELKGVYNASAPVPLPNKALTKTIARTLNRPFIPAPAPKFILRAVMGEMATMLLNSQNTSSTKIEAEGFEFRHPDLENALRDIFRRKV